MSSSSKTPTSTELTEAIQGIMAKGATDWRPVHKTLKEEHPDWNLQERRTAKFVKRQKAGKPGLDDESVSSSVGGSVRRWIKERSNRRINKADASKQPEELPPEPVPTESKEEESQLPPIENEAEEEPELLPEVPDVSAARAAELTDAPKEGALCEGCVLL